VLFEVPERLPGSRRNGRSRGRHDTRADGKRSKAQATGRIEGVGVGWLLEQLGDETARIE
jgi:hypothetical protein